MEQDSKRKLLVKLRDVDSLAVSDNLNWPNAYCKHPDKIKAIILGCDPSNKHDQNLKYAFGIETNTLILKNFFSGIKITWLS